MTKKFIRSTCLFLAAVVTISFCVMTTAAFGIDQATLDFYAENNIYFYDPTESNSCSGNVNIAGIEPKIQDGSNIENAKIVMDALLDAGYNAISVAAIAGNIEYESGFYPCKVEASGVGCDSINTQIDANGNEYIKNLPGLPGFGLIQWTTESRKDGLISLAESQSKKVTDLNVQIERMITELKGWNSQKPSSPEALNELSLGLDGLIQATWRVYRYFETPATSFRWEGGSTENGTYGTENKLQPTDPLSLNEVDHAGAYNEFYRRRIAGALYYLDLLNASGYSNLSSNTNVEFSSDVSIVAGLGLTIEIADQEVNVAPEEIQNTMLQMISNTFDGAETVDDISKATKKYIIYVTGEEETLGLEDVQEKAASIGDGKTIFFATGQASTINAVREVAKTKDNVKLIDYSTGTEDDNISKTYKAVQSVANAESLKAQSCVGTVGGVTYKQIDGQTWAYPNAGVTKKSYGPIGTMSAISGTYDFSGSGWGLGAMHHDYPAVDIGKRDENNNNISKDVPVVAFTDGTIIDYHGGYNNYSYCASIWFQGDDGARYWIGHSLYDEKYEELENVHIKAGTQISVIGPDECGGVSHTHIDERGCEPGGKGVEREGYYCTYYDGFTTHYSTHILDIIQQLYFALPEDD